MYRAFCVWLLLWTGAGVLSAFSPQAQPVEWERFDAFHGGQVSGLAADAAGHLFVAVSGSGLYTSPDGGRSWQPLSTGLPGLDLSRIGFLRIGPDGALYARGQGLYRSEDGGASWTDLGLPDSFAYDGIAFGHRGERCVYTGHDVVCLFAGETTWRPLDYWENPVADLAFDPFEQLHVISSTGTVYRLSLDGRSWESRGTPGSPSEYRDKALLFTREGTLLAATDGVYRSTDRGTTWQRVIVSSTSSHQRRLVQGAGDTLYALVPTGIFRSTDDGVKWTKLAALPPGSPSQLVLDGGNRIFAGTSRGVYRTGPEGGAWEEAGAKLGYAPVLGVLDGRRGRILAPSGGSLHYSDDAGRTWARLPLPPTSSNIPAFTRRHDGSLLMAGRSLFRSTDDGVTWALYGSPLALVLYLEEIRPGLLLAGTGQGVYYSTDGSLTWRHSDLEYGHAAGFAASGDTLYAAGSYLQRSTDAGRTWTGLDSPSRILYDVVARPGGVLLVAATDGLFRSEDGGRTWSRPWYQAPNREALFHSLVETPSGTLYAAGPAALRSDDEGRTWEVLPSDPAPQGEDQYNSEARLTFGASGHLYWATQQKGLFRTTLPVVAPDSIEVLAPDAGAVQDRRTVAFSWRMAPFAATYDLQVATDAAFLNRIHERTGLADTTLSLLVPQSTRYFWRVRPVNGYATSAWSPVRSFEVVFGVPSLVSPPPQAFGVASRPVAVWRAVDGATGYHLQLATTSDFAAPLIDELNVRDTTSALGLLPYGATFYWRVRAREGSHFGAWCILRRFTISSGVATEAEPSLPTAYALLPAYPNPFNPETTLTFELPEAAFVTLDVFDASGRAVATVLEARLPPGRHRVVWKAGGLPSGVYLCRLRAGGHVLTRTLSLVK